MTTAPATLTASDKQEEVRMLHIEITKLTGARDLATDAAKVASLAAEDASRRAAAISVDLAALESSQAGAAAEIREFVADCRNVLQSVVSTMELAAAQTRKLEESVVSLCEQVRGRTKELNDLRDSFAKENESMSQKRDDLDIYRERIVAAAAEHLPGTTVKI